MSKISWYINRLRAMNVPEVYWRLKQRQLQKSEASDAKANIRDVSKDLIYRDVESSLIGELGCILTQKCLPLMDDSIKYIFGDNPEKSIHLLGDFNYDDFRTKWNAGFNTSNDWPKTQSYSLQYKQCDEIGDARLNWELNRGFQFALLARRGDVKELDELLESWCNENRWLIGISWTSVMEIAIRAIQWTIAAYFLSFCDNDNLTQHVKRRLETGSLNMAKYVSLHYSRYSSANNHLLVEALCLVFVGTAFGINDWHDLGFKLLDEELLKQNFTDGVNKEMALHYQTFSMEAYAWAVIVSGRYAGKVPDNWMPILKNMCDFVAYSISAGRPMEWGDNDEGKIIDLKGGKAHQDHYSYVLELFKLLSVYHGTPNQLVKHFELGGYTFAKSTDHKVMIGIDHAPLGFGNIAAHGHADALSIQLIYDGVDVFSDPGTYVYHCNLPKRNDLRKTINHNTLSIEGRDQSEMLGAFLWGKKAVTKVESIKYDENRGNLFIKASHDGYNPVIHHRTVIFDGERNINITDELSEKKEFILTFVLGSKVKPRIHTDNSITLSVGNKIIGYLTFKANSTNIAIDDIQLSYDYGALVDSKAIRLKGNGNLINTEITLI